nr:sigma-70 family RNA polymerase sigma factor [uncultured Agathobaculum sp.]
MLSPLKKYYASSAEQDDLISIGTIGLIKAVSTFRPDKNIRLATYASKCIQNELLMHFRQKRKHAGELSLSDALETDGDGNALSLQDVICCEDDGLSSVEEHDRYNAMHQALAACLSPREREIIRLRYGLGLPAPLPQREIAKLMGISRSYVSRIEKRALEKLRCALGSDA